TDAITQSSTLSLHDALPISMYPEFKTMPVAGVRTASGAVQPVRIQQSRIATDSEIHVIPVRENIYVLTGPGGNVTVQVGKQGILDRKSTRLNSSHEWISYAV